MRSVDVLGFAFSALERSRVRTALMLLEIVHAVAVQIAGRIGRIVRVETV